MSKKRKISLLTFIICFLLLSSSAFADSLVTGGYYVTVGTRELGKVTIYFPSDYQDDWAYINGLPVTTANSTITGYILTSTGTGRYTVRMYNYCNGWSYRTYGSSTSTYQDLTVNAFFPKESSIFVKKYRGNTQNIILYVLVAFGCISVIGLFFKRS